MKKILKYILPAIITPLLVAGFVMAQSLWYPSNNDDLRPVDDTWGLQVPVLVGGSGVCVGVDEDGVFSTTTCVGSESDPIWAATSSNYYAIASDSYVLNTGDTITGTLTVEGNTTLATTTIGGDLTLGDDQHLYFDTAKNESIRYSPITHGSELVVVPGALASEDGLYLYANTGADGGGNWEPYMDFSSLGRVQIVNTSQGDAGEKYFLVDMTDGVKLDTGGNRAVIKADNLATSDKTFQFPNYSGTFITSGNLSDIDLSQADNTTSSFITATLTDEQVQDLAGAMATSNTETLITVTYQDGDGTMDYVVLNDLHSYDWTNVDDGDIPDAITVTGYMQDEDINTFNELQAWVGDEILLASSSIDTFAELNLIVADKTLINEEDAVQFDSTVGITGALTVSGTSTLATTTITGDLTVNTDDLFVDTATGYVGIGTTTPQATLHIATNVGSGVKLERGTLDARWWGASNGPAYFGTISNDALNIQTNNINRMTIASGATGGAVDVVGDLTAGNLKIDGATGDESVFNDDSLDCDFRIESNSNSAMFFVDGGNNRVGIGTTTPSVILSVGATSTQQFLVNNLGVISDGVWEGTKIDNAYIASSTEYLAGGSDVYWTGTSTNLVAATGRTSLELGTMALLANTGSSTITTLGTIATGIWNGTAILDTYIASSTEYLLNTTYTALNPVVLNGTVFTLEATTSAGWLALTSDETGTGKLVFDTSPTFTTGITVPNNSISAAELDENDTFSWTGLHSFGATSTLATTTISNLILTAKLDISSYTNLTASGGIALSGDDIQPDTGFEIPLSASTTHWATTYDWKSVAIDASDRLRMEYGGTETDLSAIAEGGLIVGDGAGSVGVLNVGTDGYVFTASSTAAKGVTWAEISYSELDPIWDAASSTYYLKTEIDTQGEMEAIWSVDLATDSELHNAVTITGEDFLSLSTQQITANAINPDNLANTDFGDFTCNGTNCSFDIDTIAAAEMADADHGDVAWSSGVASVQDLTISSEAAGDVLYFDGNNWVRLAKDEGKYLKSGASAVSWNTPAGAGNVTSVGDCSTGACFDGTSDGGTYLDFYDAQGRTRLIGGDNTSIVTLTLPNATGTLIYSGGAFHDGFSDFVANEHLDWTSASVGTIDPTNYTVNLNDLANPDGNTALSMTTNQLKLTYTNPTTADGALEIEASGAFSGDLIHVHQHTGNPSAVDLLHLEADDADVIGLRVVTAGGYAGLFTGGNVGIGTTSPSQLFTVGNNNQFTITSAGAVDATSLTLDTALDISDDTNLTAGRSLTKTDDDIFADAELYIYKAKIAFENPTADDDKFFGEIANAVTFTSIYCKTEVGTMELDVQIAGSDIHGSDISCNTSGVLQESLGGDTAGAVGEELKLAITSAEASTTYFMVQVNGFYDD